MTGALSVIQPGDECAACGHTFVRGDKAVCIVFVPTSENQTVCIDCYTFMLAGAVQASKAEQPLTLKAAKKLLYGFAANASDENDSQVMEP